MVTLVLSGFTGFKLLGNDPGIIAKTKLSLLSTRLSFIMTTSNLKLVCPAGMTTLYGPDT